MPLQQLIWSGDSPTRLDPSVYRAPDASDWAKLVQQIQQGQRSANNIVMFMTGQSMLAGQPFQLIGDLIWPAYNDAIGFIVRDTPFGSAAPCLMVGQVERSDWTPVSGTNQLDPGKPYFLSPTLAGGITLIAPSLQGQIVIELGRALSEDVFDVKIQSPIGL